MTHNSEIQDEAQEAAAEEPRAVAPPAPRRIKVNSSCTCT